jgi:hypothetical protein
MGGGEWWNLSFVEERGGRGGGKVELRGSGIGYSLDETGHSLRRWEVVLGDWEGGGARLC